MAQVYENHGVRFEYPEDWELEETDHGEVATVAVSVPDGLGFAVITTDVTCPDPESASQEALEALREEYPGLDSKPVMEAINGQATTGHDIEFFALDMANSASIRCFRTPRRTVLVFGQWSDVGPERTADQIRHIFRSVEETEMDEADDEPFAEED
jgi:hypothetical protein